MRRPSRHTLFLLSVLIAFVILRVPSLFEPYWYGDEGIYQVIGMGLREGRVMYLGVWDNKPPILLLLYALFNGDQYSLRYMSLMAGTMETVAFFFITRYMFRRNLWRYVSTAIFSAILATPLIEGTVANTENYMILPILTGIYFFLKSQGKNAPLLILSGFLMSIAVLMKVVAVFDAVALLVTLVAWRRLKGIMPFVLGACIPVAITVLGIGSLGLLYPFLEAVFLDNAGYTAWKNYFIISNGLLYLKTAALAAFMLFLLSRRKKISERPLFALIWFASSLYSAYFTGRGYPHYLLLFVPSLIVLTAIALARKHKTILGFLLCLILILPFHFPVYWNLYGYYDNFLAFKAGLKSQKEYYEFFDPQTTHIYDIARFIRANTAPEDSVFIWSNAAQTYKLAGKLPPGRFSVAYHITQNERNLTETQHALDGAKPKFIIILPVYQPYPYGLDGYDFRESRSGALIYEYRAANTTPSSPL